MGRRNPKTSEGVLEIIERGARDGITELRLRTEGLTELPPEIAKLTNLEYLDLAGNQLTELPSQITKLTNLTSLDLRGNQLTELPPEITKLTRLDLNINQLTELPAEITRLTNLTSLDLRGNQLTELPPEIGKLTNLTFLGLSNNQLTELPSEITKLTNLTDLRLDSNQLTEMPSEIAKLKNLAALEIEGNRLTELPTEIGKLKNLTQLHVSDNKLTKLPTEIGKLTNLTQSNFRQNQIAELPTEIGSLTNLTGLGLGSNRLTELPSEIGKLKDLAELDLDGNQLTELPLEMGNLTNLRWLALGSNQLTKLPTEISKLTNLARLFLSDNRLTELPTEIARLTNLETLHLEDNQLPIPPEILEKTDEPAAIINYYFKHMAAEKRPLNEAKMILVGQGSVGKTSLVKQLLGEGFDEHEDKTEGIDIREWEVRPDNERIRVNVWDFGGQEIMHATHQFFLTKRSLSVLVLDNRIGDEENRVEYWLKIIGSFGEDSPIIVVGNKTDQQALDIDRPGLRKKYPNIKAFLETSCEKGRGIEDLKKVISREIDALEHVHDQFLNTWFAVKARLERMEEDHISYTDYVGICNEHNVTDELSQRTLVGFLHDLGIVLNFQDDPRLEDTNILNPDWVTNGVYKILNSNELFQNKGILEWDMLDRILVGKEYPKQKYRFIMDMMRKFELCYKFDEPSDRKYLIPDLLPKGELATGDWTGALAFQYHYNVLPNSIISRFIVRMQSFVQPDLYWRTGVMPAHEKNEALVNADIEDKKIFIWIRGPEHTRRDFLSKIRGQFDSIHDTISAIQADEKVPVPDHPEIVVDYKHLLRLQAMGESSFVPEGLGEKVDVRRLLDGVESHEDLEKGWLSEPVDRAVGRIERELPPVDVLSQRTGKLKRTPSVPLRGPWSSGSFYLFALVVITALISVVNDRVPLVILPFVIIGGLLGVVIIGALQLRHDEKLSEAGFLTLMKEALKRMLQIKGANPSEDALEEKKEDESA